MFRQFAEFIHHFRWPVLLVMLISVYFFGIALTHLSVDPSMETLFIKKSPEYQYYQQYRVKYGSDQMIAVAMSTEDLFTMENLKTLKSVTDGIASYSQVERVISLTNAMDIKHKMLGVKTVPALEGVFEGARSIGEAKAEILHNELYVSNIVSKDGKHQCMPVCADFGVYDEVPEYKAMDMHQRSLYLKGLDRIVDAIVEQVPLSQRAGVIRWGKALGQL